MIAACEILVKLLLLASAYSTNLLSDRHILIDLKLLLKASYPDMSEVLKAEKDFSAEVDKQLPQAEELAKTNVQAAIEKLLLLEKQARQVSVSPVILCLHAHLKC